MSLRLLKTLFESPRFQQVLDEIAQLEYKNELSYLPENDQVKCLYYNCVLEGVPPK